MKKNIKMLTMLKDKQPQIIIPPSMTKKMGSQKIFLPQSNTHESFVLTE